MIGIDWVESRGWNVVKFYVIKISIGLVYSFVDIKLM